jgi:radical SAM protein with 4Fe4S-binding SPASM domain
VNRPQPPNQGVLEILHEHAFRVNLPLHVSLELTLQCPLRCSHCYNFDRNRPAPARGPDLAFDEILSLMDDLRAAGTLFLSITGGEPLAHARIWDLLEEAAARHFAVNLQTNGTLLTEKACNRLARHRNLWGVSLSVYGATPETHDALTRTRGSFQRTLDGLRRLKTREIPVTMKFLATRANAREFPSMIALAEAESVPFLTDVAITPRHDGTPDSLDCRIDLDTLEELYRGPLLPLLPEPPPGLSGSSFTCSWARGYAAVSASGDVWPCIAAPIRAGNIRERSFREIWKDSPVLRRIRRFPPNDPKPCIPCSLKAWCFRCPGETFLIRGRKAGVDPRRCREAELLRNILSQRRPASKSPDQPLVQA